MAKKQSFFTQLRQKHPLDGIENKKFTDTAQLWNDRELMTYINKYTTEGKHKRFLKKLEVLK